MYDILTMYHILTYIFLIIITINNTLHVVVVDLSFAPRGGQEVLF